MKCKAKREVQDPQAVFTKSGTPAVKGICPVCGTKLYRMGRTEAHNGMAPPEKKMPRQRKRSGKLVIVESPAKARTVKQFLGKGYDVKASVGHVRDLLRSQISVDVDNNFKPKYRVPNEKREIVKELKKQTKKAKEVYLATDPDREGEAIAWHLMESAEIDPEVTRRVVFHEITKQAISEAFADSREIDMNLVDAQQARRVLDRLVGYNLSPLLWRKVRGRLSAGRVQSVALRLVVEREREIESFVPVESWTIEADFQPQGSQETYRTKLIRLDGEKVDFGNQGDVTPVVADMQNASYLISEIKHGERKRNPSAPFITSTLQQEASRRLGLNARRTMRIAQQLYEGIDLGEGGPVGLITYMRTDSTSVSKLAQDEVRKFVSDRYGDQFLPQRARDYKTKAKAAQEAHEAIRPTSVMRQPDALKKLLSSDQYRLYNLIWQRFVGSQMASAVYDTLVVYVTGKTDAHSYLLRVSGSTIRFQGYLVLYTKAREKERRRGEDEGVNIPKDLSEGQMQRLLQLIPEQHFSQPPARYSEASLVRALEENGIGRPSTYAPILATLQQRGYVTREDKRLHPTETGLIVSDLLTGNFPDILNVSFTAQMESNLDKIAAGALPWVAVVDEFYGPFSEDLKRAEESIPEMNTEPEKLGRNCPESGHELVVRWGRYGKFISCSNFPTCRYTEPWLEKIGVACPKDGGEIVERRTRKGRVFFGCSNYPSCDFTSWKRPLPQVCPNCSGLLVVAGKHNAQCLSCENQFDLHQITEKNPTTETEAA
ncbi:type I DNA topoisomerase [Chloroflexota bacterium]